MRVILALFVIGVLMATQGAWLRAEPATGDPQAAPPDGTPAEAGPRPESAVGQGGEQAGSTGHDEPRQPSPRETSRDTAERHAPARDAVTPPRAAVAVDPVDAVPVKKRPWYRFEASLEMGFLGVVFHRIQQSRDGTWFDYVNEGGQNNLFLFLRTSAGVRIKDRHVILFLYQPLTLETQAMLRRDVTQEGVLFPAGTPMNLRYGFDFYRGSYLYDFFKSSRFELSVGASMQIRNADITFTSADGSLRSVSQNLGPVPLLKVRGRYTFQSGWWLGLEADGIYTNLKFLNGSQRSVEGALLDASLRAGIHVGEWVDVFVNLRYVGGGAKGGGADEKAQGDGFTRNWIHLVTLSLGLGIY